MSLLTSIKLDISNKLLNKEYRSFFFRRQTQDEIAVGIKSLRRKRNKRQSDLARETGMKQPAISRIEQADYSKWNLNTLFRVADALDARVRVIFEPLESVIESYRHQENTSEYCETHIVPNEPNANIEKIIKEEIGADSSDRSISASIIISNTS